MAIKLYSIDSLESEEQRQEVGSVNILLAASSPVVFRIGSLNFLQQNYKGCRIVLRDGNENYAKTCLVEIIHNGVDENGDAYQYINTQYCYNGILDIEHYKEHDNLIRVTSDFYETLEYVMSELECNSNPIIYLTLIPKVSLLKENTYLRSNKNAIDSYSGFQNKVGYDSQILTTGFTLGYWRSSVKYGNLLIGIPSGSSDILLYDISDDTYTLRDTGLSIISGSKYRTGVVTSSGILYCMPYDEPSILKYDIDTDTLSFIGDFTGRSLRYDTCVISNNKIYAIPASDTAILILDLIDDSVSFIGDLATSTSKYNGSVSVGNYVYSLPYTNTEFLKLNTSTNQISFIDTGDSTSQKWTSCVEKEGIIYGIPFDHQSIIVFNTHNDTFKYVGDFGTLGNKWHKCILHNNKIYAIPSAHKSVLIFDIETYYYKLVGDFTEVNNKWWSGDLFDNYLYGLPNQSADILKFNVNPYTENETILDLRYDNNVYVDFNNHVVNWTDKHNDIIHLIANGSLLNGQKGLYFEDSKLELPYKKSHSFLNSDFIIQIKLTLPDITNRSNIIQKGALSIDSSDYEFFIYQAESQLIFSPCYDSSHLILRSYLDNVGNDNEFTCNIVRIGDYMAITLNGVVNSILDVSAYTFNENSDPIRMLNHNVNETYDVPFNGFIKYFKIIRKFETNIDLSGVISGSTLDIPDLTNFLPISKEKPDVGTIYFSTFNKNTLTHDNSVLSEITSWESETNNIQASTPSGYTNLILSSQGLQSDGANRLLSVSSENLPEIGANDFSFETWVKLDSTQTNHGIFNIRDEFIYQISDTTLDVYFNNVIQVQHEISLRDNKWHHHVICRINGLLLIFIDGILISETENNVDITKGIYDLTIGGIDWWGTYLKGYLDDIKISIGSSSYNNAAVERDDLAFIPPRRNSNVLPENIQWIHPDEVEDVVLALSSKNNLEYDYLCKVGNWSCNFNDNTFIQDTDILKPIVVPNEGLYFDKDTKNTLICSSPEMILGDTVTIDFWIKVNNDSFAIQSIMSRYYDADNHWNIAMLAGTGNLFLYGKIDGLVTLNNLISTGWLTEWTHVGICKLNGKLIITIGGVVLYNQSISVSEPFYNDGDIVIGDTPGYVSSLLRGNIDQIRITTSNLFKLTGNEQLGDKIL